MPDRRGARLAALSDALTAAHLDGLLVTGLPSIRYLTGFSGTSALLFVSGRVAVLITDFRYQTQARDEVGEVARVVIEPQSLWSGLWARMAELSPLEVVGFESAHLAHRDFQRLLEQGSRWRWRPTSDIVEALRERKDAGEVEAIREAAAMATSALERTLVQVRAGMTEMDVAGALERCLREAGSEGHPFPAIVASGPRAALPHARSSMRELERGDLLLLDFGAVCRGYCADVTRTVVIGPATDEQREVHALVRRANETAVDRVRAGMRGRDADALARQVIEDAGHGGAFGHGLGHGLGLEVHEAPRLSRTSDGVLPAGAVVTIEPGVYLPGWGGVRVEDDVHLADDGTDVLTRFTRDLLEIG